MDKLASMAVFVKAVETGSFADTAAALNMSGPMVGRHVRHLEEHLGVQLLTRTTRRQSLTDVGQIYYERCKVALAEVETAEACASEMRVRPRGRLRINAPVTFGSRALTPALPDYLAVYPEIQIELTLNNRIVDLVDEGFDAAIRMGTLRDSSLIARRLADYELIACASPTYLKKHGTPTTPADLKAHLCLGFQPGAPEEYWTFKGPSGRSESMQIAGPFKSNSGRALMTMAIAGAGIILQPTVLLKDQIAVGTLVPVLPTFVPQPLPMHIVFAPDRRPTLKLRSFIDFMVDRFGP